MLNTFVDIFNLVKKKIGEEDADDLIDTTIKEGINYAYIFDLSRIDKRIATSYLIPVNGAMTLPDDIHEIEKISPTLLTTEKRVGNAILTNRTNQFTLIYSYVPDALVKDTDVPDLSYKLRYALVSYGCYVYYESKKKTQMIQLYLSEYERIKADFIESTNDEEIVQDAYSEEGDE